MKNSHFFSSIAQLGLADLRWALLVWLYSHGFHPALGPSRQPGSVLCMAKAEAQGDETNCTGPFQNSSVLSTFMPLAKENQYQAQHQQILFSWKWGGGGLLPDNTAAHCGGSWRGYCG